MGQISAHLSHMRAIKVRWPIEVEKAVIELLAKIEVDLSSLNRPDWALDEQ